MEFTYTLLADGSSDKTLIPIINWTLDQIAGIRYSPQYAELTLRPAEGLLRRAEAAVNVYECDVLFVHRDAERVAVDQRVGEIRAHLAELKKPYVPVVPVRMTEAWLLVDEQAIRSAANNPNGTVELDMPRVNRLEDIANPKSVLFEKLRLASELPAGRLRKFSPELCRHRVAELITDYSQLRNIAAFTQFEKDLVTCVQALNH